MVTSVLSSRAPLGISVGLTVQKLKAFAASWGGQMAPSPFVGTTLLPEQCGKGLAWCGAGCALPSPGRGGPWAGAGKVQLDVEFRLPSSTLAEPTAWSCQLRGDRDRPRGKGARGQGEQG